MGFMEKLYTWCAKDTPGAKCTRTIFQGVIGVIVANLDIILGMYIFDPTSRVIVAALVMSILAPLQAMIGEMCIEVYGKHAKEE